MPEYALLPFIEPDPIVQSRPAWAQLRQTHSDPINLTVGTLLNVEGTGEWQPHVVKRARRVALGRTLAAGDFGYLPQLGYQSFVDALGRYAFGNEFYDNPEIEIMAGQTVGGENALYLARCVLAPLTNRHDGRRTRLVLDDGWPNHRSNFSSDFEIAAYSHMSQDGTYNHDGVVEALSEAPPGSVALLQASGYNDDGLDRTPKQWDEVLDLARQKDFGAVVIDAAYLGLCEDVASDSYALRGAVERGLLTFVSVSTSKNFGEYNGRLGGLYIANARANLGREGYQLLGDYLVHLIRVIINNPPLSDAPAIAMALDDPDYRVPLMMEVDAARDRLLSARRALHDVLDKQFPQVAAGRGLFTKLLPGGFSTEQHARLREEGVLALPSSRINIGGLRSNQIERVGKALLALG